MRYLPLLAALLVLPLPSASAASSSVELTGPASISSEGPTSATLDIALLLDGIVCTSQVNDVPVKLRIVESKGLREASLSWDEILFRIGAHQTATAPFRGQAEVGLRVWGNTGGGSATVAASYVLPPSCVGPGAQTSGEARHTLRVEVPETEPVERVRMVPVPKSETALPQSSGASIGAPDLPMPVVAAILGMLGGAILVAVKRMRGTRPSV